MFFNISDSNPTTCETVQNSDQQSVTIKWELETEQCKSARFKVTTSGDIGCNDPQVFWFCNANRRKLWNVQHRKLTIHQRIVYVSWVARYGIATVTSTCMETQWLGKSQRSTFVKSKDWSAISFHLKCMTSGNFMQSIYIYRMNDVLFSYHGPLTRHVILRVAHAPGMLGTFFPPQTSKETAS